jgi:signal transduction histidine kinase
MLNLRIPLTRTDVPAVQAALGTTGIFEGLDYRGIEVVTDIRPIPDSPWYMVAKVDRKEIMAGIGRQGGLILLFVLLGIALAGISVAFVYNRQQRSLYIKLYRAEAAASQHAQRFRGIFEGVPVSIWEEDWTDVIRLISPLRDQDIACFEVWFSEHPEVVAKALAAVKIVDVNNETLEMFGVRDKEQLVQSLEIVLSTPDTLQGFVGKLAALAQGKPEYRTEMSLRRLDNSLVHVLLTMSFPEPGSDSGTVLVTLTDITARLRAEEELRHHRDNLEKLVEVRSKAILELNASLKNRTEELEAVNKELEAFSYSVSHDLKAPLRSVDGYAGFLEEDYADKLDDEGRRLLRVVRESAKEMGQLINDLLAFSRLSRHELAKRSLDMEGLVCDVWEQTHMDREGRDVELCLENIHPCWGDQATVREVLANLIGNAVKFTRKTEHARITVSSILDGNQVAYTVRDNGAGFDMAYSDKLFSVFQRLHSANEFEGTGIGLALVKRIVQRHGGSVAADGKAGEGAAITFTLPAHEE